MMVRSASRDKRRPLLAVLALACSGPALATVLQVEVQRVDSPAAVLEQVAIELRWPHHATHGELEVTAASLELRETPYRFQAPRWHCRLERSAASTWGCAGPLRAKGTAEGTLQVSSGAAGTDLRLQHGKARLALAFPPDGAAPRIDASALPAGWLQPLLAQAWPQARFTGGTLHAALRMPAGEAGATRVEGELGAQALGLDTTDGRIAAAGLSLDGPVQLTLSDGGTQLEAEFALAGGELLAGALYVALPGSGASMAVTARQQDALWTFPRLHWNDAGALQLEGSATLRTDAESLLQALQLTLRSPDLALADARYFSSLLATAGLDGLELGGALQGEVAIADGALHSVSLAPQALQATDAAGRFALHGLDGELGWRRGDGSAQGTLRWESAQMYGLALGAAELPWHSSGGSWSLQDPTAIPMFGGTLGLEQLSWTVGRGSDDAPQLALALALSRVDLSRLADALDWPQFGGTLSGRIPSARYEHGVLTLDGGLAMQVFDGRVEIGALRLERPFGVAPTLGTDIELSMLDLVPLTEAFGFGRISGRLGGRITGLRLVDWQPVAFDAVFRTSTKAPDKRRISQRAVGDLSSVGGSGLAGGIQAQVLRLFETFPYEQIGLSCRLENNVCHMGGLAPVGGASSAGYTIVEGSGLPRITVVGHQRRVDWPVLVARLKAATEGQAPVVQ